MTTYKYNFTAEHLQKNERTTYHIIYRADKNRRTINTYQNQRINFDSVTITGKAAAVAKVAQLRADGFHVLEVYCNYGANATGFFKK